MKSLNLRTIRIKTIPAVGLGLAVAATATLAQNGPSKAGVSPALGAVTNAPPEFKSEKERMSYAVGMWVGNNLKMGHIDVDMDVLAATINDVLAGKTLKMTDAQMRELFAAHSREQREMQLTKNHKEGEAFLAENKTKPGVKTESLTLAGTTAAEMQYKVIHEGSGDMPKSNDTVTVSYHARLIDGKEFDSSDSRPGAGKMQIPMEMRMVRGLGEALKMMSTGSRWEVYLPSTLAYGDRGFRGVEPGAAVIYDIQLQSIDAPAPPQSAPAANAPLTSDIIRVPSADEMKAGRKVEVLKPEDVARLQSQATNGAAPPKQ